jgi:AmmeMemoRadiSam system protein A
MQLSPHECAPALGLARDAIRHALRGEVFSPPQPQDGALLSPAGCFVTLHERNTHRLRGCIGRLDTCPLWRAVVSAASGVLDDPRFQDHRVTLDELETLELEISVLSPLRPAAHPMDFEPASDGIYLTIAGRSGCFLPQVARETGWSREELLSRLCTEKMGFAADTWRRPESRLQVFSTQTIGPAPFAPGQVRTVFGERR